MFIQIKSIQKEIEGIVFRNKLKANGITQSMSRKGNCWDNACSETFFHLIKTEALSFRKFFNYVEVKSVVFEYIEVFYNRKRVHSHLGYKTPAKFEEELSA